MSRLLNSREAAEYLGISKEQLYHLRCAGVVRAERVTVSAARYDRRDLDEYAESSGRQRTYHFPLETVTVIYDEEY